MVSIHFHRTKPLEVGHTGMDKDSLRVLGHKLEILGRHNPLYTLLFVSPRLPPPIINLNRVEECLRRCDDIPESISCHPL
jgi:hypothetical protein